MKGFDLNRIIVVFMVVLALVVVSGYSAAENRSDSMVVHGYALSHGNYVTIYSKDMVYKVYSPYHDIKGFGTFYLSYGKFWMLTNYNMESYKKIDKLTPSQNNVIISSNFVGIPFEYNSNIFTLGFSTDQNFIFIIPNQSVPMIYSNATVEGSVLNISDIMEIFGINITQYINLLINYFPNINNIYNMQVPIMVVSNITFSNTQVSQGQVIADITPYTINSFLSVFLNGSLNSSALYDIESLINSSQMQAFIISDLNNSLSNMNFYVILAPLNFGVNLTDGYLNFIYVPSQMQQMQFSTGFIFNSIFSVTLGSIIYPQWVNITTYTNASVEQLWNMTNSAVSVPGFLLGFNVNIPEYVKNIFSMNNQTYDFLENISGLNLGIYLLLNENLTFQISDGFLTGMAIVIIPYVNEYNISEFENVYVNGILYHTGNLFGYNLNIPVIVAQNILADNVQINSTIQTSGIIITLPSLTSNLPEPFTNLSLIITNDSGVYQIILAHDNIGIYFLNGLITLAKDNYGWWNVENIIPTNFETYSSGMRSLYFNNLIIDMNTTSLVFNNTTYGINTDFQAPYIWIANGQYPIFEGNVILKGVFMPGLNININEILGMLGISSNLLNIMGLNMPSMNLFNGDVFLANAISYNNMNNVTLDILASVKSSDLFNIFNVSLVNDLYDVFGNSTLNYIINTISELNESVMLGIPNNFNIYSQSYYLLMSPNITYNFNGFGNMEIQYTNINFSFNFLGSNIKIILANYIPGTYSAEPFNNATIANLSSMPEENVNVSGFSLGISISGFLNVTSSLFGFNYTSISSLNNLVKDLNIGIFVLLNQNMTINLTDPLRDIALMIVPNFNGSYMLLNSVDVKGAVFTLSSLTGTNGLGLPILISNNVTEISMQTSAALTVTGILISPNGITTNLPEPLTDLAFILINITGQYPEVMIVHNILPYYFINGTITLNRDGFGWWNVSSINPSPLITININASSGQYIAQNVIIYMNTTSIAYSNYTVGINDDGNAPYVWMANGAYPFYDSYVELSGVYLPTLNLNRIIGNFDLNLSFMIQEIMELFQVNINLGNDVLLVNNVTPVYISNANVFPIGYLTPDLIDNILFMAGDFFGLSDNILNEIYSVISNFNEQAMVAISDNSTFLNITLYVFLEPLNPPISNIYNQPVIQYIPSNTYINIGSFIYIYIGTVL
ncbi:MAG: hypothetical protein ACP5L4_06015 [Thermoplasmata archaeon]